MKVVLALVALSIGAPQASTIATVEGDNGQVFRITNIFNRPTGGRAANVLPQGAPDGTPPIYLSFDCHGNVTKSDGISVSSNYISPNSVAAKVAEIACAGNWPSHLPKAQWIDNCIKGSDAQSAKPKPPELQALLGKPFTHDENVAYCEKHYPAGDE